MGAVTVLHMRGAGGTAVLSDPCLCSGLTTVHVVVVVVLGYYAGELCVNTAKKFV